MSSPVLQKLVKDPLFWSVHLLAILFWLTLYLIDSTYQLHLPDNLAKWGLFLEIALLYPVLEEVVFRGLIQGHLWQTRFGRTLFAGISLPNLITSLIFTSLHFIYQPPLWAAAVIIPSLTFGFFRDRYQHLMPAIWLHIFFNCGHFLLYVSR